MHPTIAEFPAKHFYDGRLNTGIGPEMRPALPGFRWPDPSRPVCFVSVRGSEGKDGDSTYNEREADEVARCCADLLAAGLQLTDVGIVTPYGAQVRMIRRLLQRRNVGTMRDHGVEVASVDSYQGREKKVIIFSAVRSNSSGSIGFVSDWRRMNVAFTRAQYGLVVFGDPSTLCREPSCWAPWLRWAEKARIVIGQMPALPPISNDPRHAVGLRADRLRREGREGVPAPVIGSGVGGPLALPIAGAYAGGGGLSPGRRPLPSPVASDSSDSKSSGGDDDGSSDSESDEEDARGAAPHDAGRGAPAAPMVQW